MGFENLNYSTTENEKINDSIQDQIDALHKNAKKRLQELKSDILSNVTDLTVTTVSSRLNIRNKSGEIIGKAYDGEKLTYLNKTITNGGKLFLHVKDSHGQRGYVSADYVKSDVIKAIKPVPNNQTDQVNPGNTTDKLAAVVDESKKTQGESGEDNSSPLTIQPASTNTPDNTLIGESQLHSPEKSFLLSNSTVIGEYRPGGISTYQNGDTFGGLVGPEFESSRELVDFNNKMEKIQSLSEKINNPKIQLLSTILTIWTDAAQKTSTQQWEIMGLKDDKQQIELGIKTVENLFGDIINTPNLNDAQINDFIQKIFREIYRIENNEEDIIDNIEEIDNILKNTSALSLIDDKAQVLKLMAGSFGDDGNTKKVLELSRNEIIKNDPELKEKLEEILKIKSYESIKVKDFTDLGLDKNDAQNLVQEIKREALEIRVANTKNREAIKKEILINFPDLTGQALTDKIEEVSNVSLQYRLEVVTVSQFIGKTINASNSNDQFTLLYNQLDSNWQTAEEWLGDNLSMIVISLIPMGAGFAAVAGVSKLGRIGYGALQASRFNKLQTLGNTIGHTGKVATFSRNFAKGAAFYEGMNTVNNALYSSSTADLFNGWDDGSEILKMGLTFGTFGLLQNKLRIIPQGQSIKSIPNKKLITRALGILTVEGAAFSSIDAGIEFSLEEGRTWGEILETFAAGVVMGGAFRGLGRVIEQAPKKANRTVIEEFNYQEPGGVRYSNLKLLENGDIRTSTGKVYRNKGNNHYESENGQIKEFNPDNKTSINRRIYDIDSQGIEIRSQRLLNTREKLLKQNIETHFKKGNEPYKIGEGDNAIQISKTSEGKYFIGDKNGAELLTLKQISQRVNSTHETSVINKLRKNTEELIQKKNPEKDFTITWREERIAKDGSIQIKENGKWRNSTESERKAILDSPEKVHKILKSKIEKADIENYFSKEGRDWLKQNGGTLGLFKNAILSKSNIVLNALFIGTDLAYDREEDIVERIQGLALSIVGANMIGVPFKLIRVGAKGGIGVMWKGTKETLTPAFKKIYSNKANIAISGAGIGGLYFLFAGEPNTIED